MCVKFNQKSGVCKMRYTQSKAVKIKNCMQHLLFAAKDVLRLQETVSNCYLIYCQLDKRLEIYFLVSFLSKLFVIWFLIRVIIQS